MFLSFAFSFSVLKIADSVSSAIWSLIIYVATRAMGGGDLPIYVQQWMANCRNLTMFVLAGVLLWLSRSYWRSSVRFGQQTPSQYTWVLVGPVIGLAWGVLLTSFLLPEIPIGNGYRFEWDPLVLAFLVTVVAAPLVEEILFRGALFSKLVEHGWPIGRVVIATTLMWAIGHLPDNLGALKFFMLLPAGVFLGWIRLKTRGVFLPIAVHSAVNLSIFVLPALPPKAMLELISSNI